jgi:hypothetical protein
MSQDPPLDHMSSSHAASLQSLNESDQFFSASVQDISGMPVDVGKPPNCDPKRASTEDAP